MLYSSKKIDLQGAEADSSNLGLKRGHRERERERRAAKEESRQIGFLGKSTVMPLRIHSHRTCNGQLPTLQLLSSN